MRQKWDATFIAETDAEYELLKDKVAQLGDGYTHPLTVATDDATRTITVNIAEFASEVV